MLTYIFGYISSFLSHFDDDFSLMHVPVVDPQIPFKCVFGFFVVNLDDWELIFPLIVLNN